MGTNDNSRLSGYEMQYWNDGSCDWEGMEVYADEDDAIERLCVLRMSGLDVRYLPMEPVARAEVAKAFDDAEEAERLANAEVWASFHRGDRG